MKSSLPFAVARFCLYGESASGKRTQAAGVALVLTLSVVVLLTIVVVAFAATMQLERAASRSNFEQKRAQSLSMLAVDEVIGKLRDNIPTDGQWAVGPGELYCTKTPTGTAPVTIDLHSGKAAGSSTGSIALNRPSLTAPTAYPIIPQNADYPTPDSMQLAWINVLQDGTRSTDSDYASKFNLTGNPIVGRYAYWTDVETCKVNLNTAGYASTGPYNVNTYPYDTQYYQSQPNRVDLAQLDPGIAVGSVAAPGQITPANSLDTYVYNSGAVLAAGSSAPYRYNPPYFPPAATAAGTPAYRYNTIDEWVRTPSRPTPGTSSPTTLSGISAAQMLANQFSLTTRSRAPELNPWGMNRVWWSCYPPGNPVSGDLGNRTNAPSATPAPGTHTGNTGPDPRYSMFTNPDNRYYVYPWAACNWNNGYSTPGTTGTTSQTNPGDPPAYPFQNFSSFSGGVFQQSQNDNSFYSFFLSLYNLLNNKNWPGMPNKSFVDKYGQSACENIVTNIMFMADSLIGSPDGLPAKCENSERAYYAWHSSTVPLKRDAGGIYGLYLWKSPINNPAYPNGHYLWGHGPWPYISEVAVTFEATTSGAALANPLPPGVVVEGMSTPTLTSTKTNTNPGFVAPIDTTAHSNWVNIEMMPQVEFAWALAQPPDVLSPQTGGPNYFKTPGNDTGIVAGLTEIVVQASGTLNGQTQLYNWSNNDYGNGDTNFTWRYGDNYASSASAVGTSTAGGFTLPLPVGGLAFPSSSPTGTSYTATTQSKYIYVGPFDKSTAVDLVISFRVGTRVTNSWLGNASLEVIPTQPALATTGGNGAAATTDTNPKFVFKCHIASAGTVGAISYCQSYEAIDPRVYQDMSDWVAYSPTATFGANTLGAQNSIYTSTNKNDSYLDDSKYAWPTAEFLYDQAKSGTNVLPQYQGTNAALNNRCQTATSVTGMPGMGWLSLISTADYTKGAVSEAWKTLKLSPEIVPNELPDWLMMELFAVVYDQSYCSQTSGKINLNGQIMPFINSTTALPQIRSRPLQALIGGGGNGLNQPGTTSDSNVTITSPSTVAQNIANRKFSSGAVTTYGTSTPSIYVYPGEICQIAGVSDSPTPSTKVSTQFDREALARDILGLVTTQSSDFLVHVVAQSVKQVANNGNPNTDLVILSEQRGQASLERAPDLGPDGIPGTADDLAGPDGVVGTLDDLALPLAAGGTTSTLVYDPKVDKMLYGGAGYPPFHYRVTKFKSLTQ